MFISDTTDGSVGKKELSLLVLVVCVAHFPIVKLVAVPPKFMRTANVTYQKLVLITVTRLRTSDPNYVITVMNC
jgi:hypothetical protein